MSIFIYFRYFLNSVRLRGLFNTLMIPYYERKYESFFGIKTKGMKVSASKSYFHYQGATYFSLFKIMKELKCYTKTHTFYDIGCGKGRALIVAEHFGFQKILGNELDSELASIALQNIKKQPLASEIIVLHENALVSNYPKEPTVYFLFNPFNGDVLRQVLLKIKTETLNRNIFVYLNPLHKHVFEEQGLKKSKEIYTHKYLEAVIYSTTT